MQGKISVEILGHRIKDLLSLDHPGQNKIHLTTSDDLQKSGKVKIYLHRDGERVLLKEILVKDIPPADAGEPDIDLIGEYTAKGTLELRILLNGKLHLRIEVDLRAYSGRKKKVLLFLIPLGLLLLLLFFLNPFGRLGRDRAFLGRLTAGREQVELPSGARAAGLESSKPSTEIGTGRIASDQEKEARGLLGPEKTVTAEEGRQIRQITEQPPALKTEAVEKAQKKTGGPPALIIAIAKVRQQRIEQPPALIIAAAEESQQITEQPPALKTVTSEEGRQITEQPPALKTVTSEEGRQITELPPALKTVTSEKDFSAEPEEEESGAVPPAQAAYQAQTAAVYFAADSDNLSPATRESLEQILPEILAKPSRPVSFGGHCALYGSEAGRTRLSLQRAKNVAGFLRKKGWQPQVEPTIVGLGAREPITLDKEKQYLNRRVEISY